MNYVIVERWGHGRDTGSRFTGIVETLPAAFSAVRDVLAQPAEEPWAEIVRFGGEDDPTDVVVTCPDAETARLAKGLDEAEAIRIRQAAEEAGFRVR